MAKKQWSDLSPAARTWMVLAGIIEVVLTTTALRDLRKRSADTVKGPKWMWVLICLIQPVGPPAYLLLGRRAV